MTRFVWIMTGLMKAVAERSGKIPDDVLMLIWLRVQRTMRRFIALAETVRAGTYRPAPPRPARTRPRPPPRPPDADRRPMPGPWPRRFAWVCVQVPSHAAGYGSQLRHLLDDPQMAALVAAAPGLRRMLRPLLPALGQVPHPALAEPPREAPRPAPVAEMPRAGTAAGEAAPSLRHQPANPKAANPKAANPKPANTKPDGQPPPPRCAEPPPDGAMPPG